jgi:hypothetical protein
MATSDMSLGGGAGFGAGYTPIRFAPLVSLTGPVMAPATPAAPEAAAPMLRPPMMVDQSGGYEIPTRTDAAFENLQPIGTRIEQNGIGPELRDLGRGLSFMTSPLMSTGSLLATGKLPLDYVLGEMGGAGGNPFAGFLQGLQGLLGGGQQRAVEVPIGPQMLSEKAQGGVTSIGGIGGAAYNDAVSIASGFGLSNEVANAAGRTAAGLVAQGMDPQTAVTLAANYAAYADRSQMPDGMPAPGGQAQGLPGLSRNEFDLTTPVAPQAAQTFGLGQPGNIESSTQIGGMGGAESPFGGFTGGDWGPGDTPGGYDTNTGAYSDITGFE